jgi:hypothetical protein
MRKQKEVQPVYELEEHIADHLADATDFNQFACQPHTAQKNLISCLIWEFYEQEGVPDVMASLLRLSNYLTHQLAEPQEEETRRSLSRDAANVNAILSLLLKLDTLHCFPKYD